MISLRKEQVQVLAQAAEDRFVERARTHLQVAVPQRCAPLSEDTVTRSIRTAIAQSRRYELTSDWAIIHYLNTMYVLGFQFDTDPQHVEAARMLTDPELDAKGKVNALIAYSRAALAAAEAKEGQPE